MDEQRRGGRTVLGEAPNLRIPKTAELVADSIRRRITGGQLGEGDNLPTETQILEEFAISRPTVREAFRILESEKLISVSRGARGGARVHPPQAAQVARYAEYVLQTRRATYEDVYGARILIEPPAARLVAETRSQDAPPILNGLIADQREALKQADFGRAVVGFHTRLIELTGNQTMILISGMLDGIVARFQSDTRRPDRRPTPKGTKQAEAGLRSQQKLVELIAAGDGAGAELHWRLHMENSAKVWLGSGPASAVVDWLEV